MKQLCFAQMLASRLCHDLITPIGALNTGLELLEDCSEEDWAQLMALSRQSAQTASRRLVYYRAAFGFSAASYLNSIESLSMFITDYIKPQKINLNWPDKPTQIDPLIQNGSFMSFSRILLNIVLLAAELAPHGGNMTLLLTAGEDGWHLSLTLSGNILQMRQDIKDALTHGLQEEQYSPHNIHGVITQMLLRNNDVVTEELSSTKEQLSISLRHKAGQQNMTGLLF